MTPEHQALINRIRASATGLQRAVATTPADKRTTPAREGEWSVQQVLLHTRDAAMLVFGLRIRRLLFETDPVFASYDEEAYRKLNPGTAEKVDDILHMTVAEHELTARLLENLPDESWQRSGRHPESGMRDIEYFARRMAEHAEEHVHQILDFRF